MVKLVLLTILLYFTYAYDELDFNDLTDDEFEYLLQGFETAGKLTYQTFNAATDDLMNNIYNNRETINNFASGITKPLDMVGDVGNFAPNPYSTAAQATSSVIGNTAPIITTVAENYKKSGFKTPALALAGAVFNSRGTIKSSAASAALDFAPGPDWSVVNELKGNLQKDLIATASTGKLSFDNTKGMGGKYVRYYRLIRDTQNPAGMAKRSFQMLTNKKYGDTMKDRALNLLDYYTGINKDEAKAIKDTAGALYGFTEKERAQFQAATSSKNPIGVRLKNAVALGMNLARSATPEGMRKRVMTNLYEHAFSKGTRDLIQQNVKQIRKEVIDGVKGTAKKIGKGIQNTVNKGIKVVKNRIAGAKKLANTAKKAVSGAAKKAQKQLTKTLKKTTKALKQLRKDVKNGVIKKAKDVKKTLKKVEKTVKKAVNGAKKYVKKTVKGAKKYVKGKVNGAKRYAKKKINSMKKYAKKKINGAKKTVTRAKNYAKKKINNVKRYAKNKMNNAKKYIKKRVNNVKKTVKNAKKNVGKAVKKAKRTAKRAMKKAGNTAKKAIKKARNTARKAGRSAKKAVKKAGRTAKRTVKKAGRAAKRTVKRAGSAAKRTIKRAGNAVKKVFSRKKK